MDSKQLLKEFNQKYSLNVPIVIQTNFHGDLTPDDEEWLFYDIKTHEYLTSTGKCYIEDIGCFRTGPYFKQSKAEGFTLFKLNSNKEIFPVSANSFTFHIYIDYKAKKFSYHVDYIFKENLFKRWWIDDLNIIKLQYPEKAETIKCLCSDRIKELNNIAETKNYKRGWIYYHYNSEKMNNIINQQILNNTCFYYNSMIFYNQFADEYITVKVAMDDWDYLRLNS